MKSKTFSCGSSPYRIQAQVIFVGSDLLVALSGGSKPHIGSVAVALPRPSLRDRKQMSSTSSVYNFLGHKDYVVAQRVAEHLSSKLNTNVVVVAGIHIDAISEKGIAKVVENCDKLAKKIYEVLEDQE